MSSKPRWRRAALVVLALAGVLFTALPAAAESGGEEEEEWSDGAVEITYREATEIRPGEGWRIVCEGVGTLPGVTITCSDDSVTLAAEKYDPKWGTNPLRVPQAFGDRVLDLTYRVRFEPPPAPEIAVTRLDEPIPVGEQFLIPISALAITCAVCSEEGGAKIEAGTPPPGVAVGVTDTHLVLRASAPGDAVIPIAVTDDAGQKVDVELTASFVPASGPAPLGALHIVSPADTWELADLVWGDDVLVVCSPTQSIGIGCTDDGRAERTGTGPAQLLFRAVDADGRMAWGSITATAPSETPADGVDAEQDAAVTLAAPAWKTSAPLVQIIVPADGAQEPEATTPLADLAKQLEGIPAS